MENGEVEGGGIFVVRGEGTNGVISVDLPTPPPTEASDDPVMLTYENVTYMEVEITDHKDSLRTYGESDIETAAYVIEFEYEWDNSVIQKYLIRNNYDGDY